MSQSVSVLEHPVIAGARAAADGLTRACRAEAWQLSDTEVETGLDLVAAAESRLGAVRAVLVGEAELRGLRERTKALSTASWLADRHRWSRSRAAAVVATAAGLARHPVVAAGLAEATLTGEQARVAVAVLDRIGAIPGLPDGDRQAAAECLIGQAAALDPRRLGVAGQALYEALYGAAASIDDPADEAALRRAERAAEDAARRAETNTLRVRRRPDGRTRGSFELSPLGAAALAGWLKHHADPRHPGTDGFEDQRLLPERRGDALVELLGHALGRPAGEHGDLAPTGTDGPAAAELPFSDAGADDPDLDDPDVDDADADDADLDDADADDPDVPKRARGGSWVQVAVTIGLAELQAGLAGAGVLDTGGTLSAAEARRLACDAGIIPVVLAGPDQPLNVGRATKKWNLAQRRYIYARDRGCVAPGCDRAPADCQIHHQWAWADGGPTDVDNGALLCLYHHQQVHRQGWTVTMAAANGKPQLTPPPGIDPERRPRQHHRFRLTLLTSRQRN